MAYPFQQLIGYPQTPQHTKEAQSPPLPVRLSRPGRSTTRIALAGIVSLFVLTYMFHAFSKDTSKQSDRVPFPREMVSDYMTHFEGRQDCGISSEELYVPPVSSSERGPSSVPYCKNRATLLEALNGGGRHGFDAPFSPQGCHYRWYSTPEICMILDRFDGVIFIGDTLLRHVYTAFNILQRENAALGGLKQWDMSDADLHTCRCENQFIKPDCSKFAVMDSEEVKKGDASSSHRSPYFCDRTRHVYLPITGSPAADSLHTVFTKLADANPDSYKPIPVIHSLSLSASLSWPTTTASMDEWLALADASQRNMPFLWLGPVAAGHLKPPGQILSQGNNALWHFTVEMAKEARHREMDSLGMYNLTLQASSWDGSRYGEKVSIVQAMMIINWLSRLESS